MSKGVIHKLRHALRERGVKEFETVHTKGFFLWKIDKGEGGRKIVFSVT